MGILNPIALTYLSLISLVVFIYFFNRRANIIYVPSIIPWKELKGESVSSRLLKIDLLFLLQIFLIILLSLFLARPYLTSDIQIQLIRGNNKIIILDASASMQTIEKDGSRFEEARDFALKLVDDMNPADKAMLILAHSSSEIILDLTSDKKALKKAIRGLKPTETGTDLEGALSLGLTYLEATKNAQLYVLTDRPRGDCGLRAAELDPKLFQFKRFGKSNSNVAISSLDIFQDVFNEKNEAYVSLKNFSDEAKEIKLKVSLIKIDKPGDGSMFNLEPSAMKRDILIKDTLTLGKEEQKTITIRNIPEPGILKAEIETDDSLKVDNRAYGIVKKRGKTINILLVTDNEALKTEIQRLGSAFGQINIHSMPPEVFIPHPHKPPVIAEEKRGAGDSYDILKDFDIGIFHKLIPPVQPGINSLFIAPTNGLSSSEKGVEPYLSYLGVIEDVNILDWDDTHPAMRHIQYLDNIDINRAILLKPPDDSKILISASGRIVYQEPKSAPGHDAIIKNNHPIAFSTQFGGRKAVILGFDVAGFNLSDTNNLPVLIMMLNMIQWLSPLGDKLAETERLDLVGNDQIKTGGQHIIHDTGSIKEAYVIMDEQKIVPLADIATRDTASTLPSGIAGHEPKSKSPVKEPYILTNIKHTGIYVIKASEKDDIFVANLFDANESNLKQAEPDVSAVPNPAILGKQGDKPISITRHEKNEISRHILYLIPFLLLIEWVYSYVRLLRS